MKNLQLEDRSKEDFRPSAKSLATLLMANSIRSLVMFLAAMLIWGAQLKIVHAESTVPYLLGAGDQLILRAVVWDEGRDDFAVWDVVSGVYTVSSEGTLTVPLAGTLAVDGHSVASLASELSAKFHERVTLIEPPSVTLEIEEYRPFYVLGDVDNSGAFEATPGLTVFQAFALAGGAPLLRDVFQGDLRGVLRDAGNLGRLQREQVRARLHAMRLRAELVGAPVFEPTEELVHPDGEAALARLIMDEEAIFDARQRARELESENLEELKVLLITEIASLEAKRAQLAEQILSARENTENMTELGERGLARSNQLRDAQRAVFELESQDIDLQSNIFRAQQRIKEADRDILALQTRLATQVATELLRVNADIEELALQAVTLRNLVEVFGADIPQANQEFITEFFLTRSTDTAVETKVTRNTIVAPGDILRVQRRPTNPAN